MRAAETDRMGAAANAKLYVVDVGLTLRDALMTLQSPATVKHDPGRSSVSALVVSAGTSSRMGRPKPLVPLAGRPLLVHALDALRRSHVLEIVVILGADADAIRQGIALEGTRVVLNGRYREGMSTSVQAGLQAVHPEADAFLVVLADQPFVRPSTIDAILAAREATRARIVLPTHRGVRGNPVLFDRSLSPEIEALAGDRGGREIVERHAGEVIEVPVEDPGILLDVDTPEDLRRIEAALARAGGLEALVSERAQDGPRRTASG